MSHKIDALHDRAKQAIGAGEGRYHAAANYLIEAQKLGATQRQSAKAIGKSAAWVNALLTWAKGGHKHCPFRQVVPVQDPEQMPTVKASSSGNQTMKHSCSTPAEHIAEREFQTARAAVVAQMFAPETKRIPGATRAALITALQTLGSGHPVERQRARLGLTWDELLVPAAEAEGGAAWAA